MEANAIALGERGMEHGGEHSFRKARPRYTGRHACQDAAATGWTSMHISRSLRSRWVLGVPCWLLDVQIAARDTRFCKSAIENQRLMQPILAAVELRCVQFLSVPSAFRDRLPSDPALRQGPCLSLSDSVSSRLVGNFHPSHMSCLAYKNSRAIARLFSAGWPQETRKLT